MIDEPVAASPRTSGSLIGGLSSVLGARALVLGIQFATVLLLARALGPGGLGMAQFGFVVFGYGIQLNDAGLTQLGTREHVRKDDPMAVARIIGGRVVLSFVFAVAVGCLVAISGRGSLLLAALMILLAVVASAWNLRWLLVADHRLSRVAVVDAAGAITQFTLALILVAVTADPVWGLGVLLAAPFAQTLLTVAARRPGTVLMPILDRRTVTAIRMALPLGVAMITTAVYYSFDVFLLGLTRSPEEVGHYAAAYRIVLACLTLPVIIHGISLPMVARLEGNDPARSASLVRGLSIGLLAVALPVAVGLTVFRGPIVDLLFGTAFAKSADLMAVLIWSIVTVSANVPFAVLLIARRHDRTYMIGPVMGAIANVVLNLIVIPRYGAMGAAVTTIISEVVVLGWIVAANGRGALRIILRALAIGAPPALAIAAAWALSPSMLVAIVVATLACGVTVVVMAAYGAYRPLVEALSEPLPGTLS